MCKYMNMYSCVQNIFRLFKLKMKKKEMKNKIE